MRKLQKRLGLVASSLFLGLAFPAWSAQPTVAQMLQFKPRQKDVVCTTPAASEQANCKVELQRGTRKASGWVLKDGADRMLRRFYDSKGAGYPDMMCYYKDGMEVYREVDTNGNRTMDEYRWLNTAGMKIGLDANEDGTIDSWQALSVEELSQEVLKTIIARDYSRFETMLVTEEDLKAIGAPSADFVDFRNVRKLSPGKFRQTAAKMSHLNENTQWLRIETAAPSRLPADAAAALKQDVLMYYRAVILCETGGKHDWIQLGEIIKIGDAWKLKDAPVPGGEATTAPDLARNTPKAETNGIDPALQPIVNKIAQLDDKAPAPTGHGPNPAVARYHLQRVDLLEELVAKVKETERDLWYRQMADSLSAAAQASPPGETKILGRLSQLAEQVAAQSSGSDIAAYVTFRAINTEHVIKLSGTSKPEDMLAVQTGFQDNLKKFVETYPKSDDTADALLQLGMNCEFQNKEADAKKWYEQLVSLSSSSPQGIKAAGALRRINIEGKNWELNAPITSLAGGQFSMDRIRGKTTIVYYWATMCPTAAADFAKLKELAQNYRSQGLEVVAVNVDDNQTEAESFIQRQKPVGYHIYGGGLEGPLAAHYGMVIFPNLFILDGEGKVINRNAQISGLEDELKKVIK